MTRNATKSTSRAALTLLALSALAIIGAYAPSPRNVAAAIRDDPALVAWDLNAVRQATARYQDVARAEADGYVRFHDCVANPGVGAMGVHYLNPARMGKTELGGRVHGTDTALDPERPELLVYAPQRDGSLRLAAVEYYASRAAWGEGPRPTLFGVPFDYMVDDPATDADEAHGFTPHYDLHVWLWQDNPAGMFAQWNPMVSCPATMPATAHAGH